jgi:hypothetical protein
MLLDGITYRMKLGQNTSRSQSITLSFFDSWQFKSTCRIYQKTSVRSCLAATGAASQSDATRKILRENAAAFAIFSEIKKRGQ